MFDNEYTSELMLPQWVSLYQLLTGRYLSRLVNILNANPTELRLQRHALIEGSPDEVAADCIKALARRNGHLPLKHSKQETELSKQINGVTDLFTISVSFLVK
jgi:hypothetical protein